MELEKHQIDVCSLEEKKKKGKGNINYHNYILFFYGKEKYDRAQSRVGIFVHKKLENSSDIPRNEKIFLCGVFHSKNWRSNHPRSNAEVKQTPNI